MEAVAGDDPRAEVREERDHDHGRDRGGACCVRADEVGPVEPASNSTASHIPTIAREAHSSGTGRDHHACRGGGTRGGRAKWSPSHTSFSRPAHPVARPTREGIRDHPDRRSVKALPIPDGAGWDDAGRRRGPRRSWGRAGALKQAVSPSLLGRLRRRRHALVAQSAPERSPAGVLSRPSNLEDPRSAGGTVADAARAADGRRRVRRSSRRARPGG